MSTAVLAADIGATSMRAALVDVDAGVLLARAQGPTRPADGFEDATDRLAALLEGVAREGGEPAVVLGVSTAGPLDPRTGVYLHPPNLPGWHGRTMRSALAERLGLPVEVGHDATLAAFAESRFGTHRGANDLVYLTVSTGIGAGIVSGGHPVTGAHGGAGEIGHLIVNPGGRACGAGCEGCLEGQSSGSAIAAVAEPLLGAGTTAVQVFTLARQGDEIADRIIREALVFLGAGIAGILAVLDPQAVILGGGMARGLHEGWWELLIEQTARFALPRYQGRPPVEMTVLGDDASLLGAAVWAIERPLAND